MKNPMRRFSAFRSRKLKPKVYRTKPVKRDQIKELNFSQEKISGFDLELFQDAKVLLIGAGALGGHVGLALQRKGIGQIDIIDHDFIELKNLTRQPFFKKDVGKYKSLVIAKQAARTGLFKTTIRAIPLRFLEALNMGFLRRYDAVLCLVDNNPTRTQASRFCQDNKIPLITSAVSRDGLHMYCAIQKPENACFGCISPTSINDNSYPCNLPGIIDITQVVSGITVFALDAVLMNRHCEWNLKTFFLDGSVPDSSVLVEKDSN